MGRASRVAVALVIIATASAVTGCAPLPWCTRGWGILHPTMTTDDLVVGNEARVRGATEGAVGGPGSGVK